MGDQDRRHLYGPQSRAKSGVETNNDRHLGGGRGRGRPNQFTSLSDANIHLFSSPCKKQKRPSVFYCANSPSTPPPAFSSGGGSVISSDGHSGSTPSFWNKPPTAPISPVPYPPDSINSSQSPSAMLQGCPVKESIKEESLTRLILRRLTDLSNKEVVVCKVGHEMVQSTYGLKLMLGCTDHELETISEKSSTGALMIEEGEKLVKEAQKLLSAALAKNAYAS